MGANEPVAPASLLQVAGTGRIVREKSLELWIRPAASIELAFLWDGPVQGFSVDPPGIARRVTERDHGNDSVLANSCRDCAASLFDPRTVRRVAALGGEASALGVGCIWLRRRNAELPCIDTTSSMAVRASANRRFHRRIRQVEHTTSIVFRHVRACSFWCAWRVDRSGAPRNSRFRSTPDARRQSPGIVARQHCRRTTSRRHRRALRMDLRSVEHAGVAKNRAQHRASPTRESRATLPDADRSLRPPA